MMSDLKSQIVRISTDLGGTLTGFSKVSGHLSEALSRYPYAITIAVRLSDAIIDEITDKPTYTYFNHYRSVNALIDHILLRIVLFIQSEGYNAYSVPASQSIPDSETPYSGVFPHKTGAVLSGLGWIGKNGLFISDKHGPRVRLGTVLTDAPLEADSQTAVSKCGSCNLCVASCPAMALTGNSWVEGCKREWLVDPKACSDYMNSNFKHIGRGSVCGICIKVCPHGR